MITRFYRFITQVKLAFTGLTMAAFIQSDQGGAVQAEASSASERFARAAAGAEVRASTVRPPFAQEGDTHTPYSPHKRDDGRRAHFKARQMQHTSDGLRNMLAGRPYEDGVDEKPPQLTHKRIMQPPIATIADGTPEQMLLEAEHNRAHHDANRFCKGTGSYRRMKAGGGWQGPTVVRSEKSERLAANNPMYGSHRFFLGKPRSEIRAGSDDMMRTLGWDHIADCERAGASSEIANKWIDEIHVPRGPAMTENSHMMRPDRNPITGHNMGDEFIYTPGERRVHIDRQGKSNESGLLQRLGETCNTKTRVFGTDLERAALEQKQSKLRTGLQPYANQVDQKMLFPSREEAVGGERAEMRRKHEQQLRMHHAARYEYSQMNHFNQNKSRNGNTWSVGD